VLAERLNVVWSSKVMPKLEDAQRNGIRPAASSHRGAAFHGRDLADVPRRLIGSRRRGGGLIATRLPARDKRPQRRP